MKDHLGHMIYLFLMIVLLVFITATAMLTVGQGKRVFRKGEDVVLNQLKQEQRGTLSDLEFKKVPSEMPMAALLAIYYEQGSLMHNIYDCRNNTNNKVTDPNNEGKEKKTIELLNNEVRSKVKVSVVISDYNTNLYDIYIHDIRCNADSKHTGKCSEQPGFVQ